MTSTYSTNKAIEEPANGDYVNTWSTPVNSNFNIIDTAFGGHVIINATGASGTVALTTAQYQNLYILFSGTLSANVNYQVPSGVGGQWVVYNGTSGAFTLTLSSGGGGSSVTITQGTRTLIVSDGTNVTLSVNAVTSPGGADTSIQFNQSGVFGGSSNLAWNYGTNTLTVTGAVNVNGTINAYYTGKSGLLINEDSSSNVFINQQDNGPLILNTNNTERMRITAAGNVGIGTSTPSNIMTVAAGNGDGIVLQASATTYGPFLRIQNTGTGGHNWNIVSNGSLDGGGAGNLSIYDATGGGNVLITGNGGIGNVGIGTNTPGYKLQVAANNNATDGLYISNTSTGASAQAVLSVAAQGWSGVYLIQNQASGNVLLYSGDNVPMIFVNNAAERMRITAAGNVGIGTSAPGYLLTVNGTGSFTGTLLANGGTVLSSVTNPANNPITGTPSSSTYLRGDGTWAAPPQIQTQILTVGTGTWTAPTGVTKVYVAVVGGGGGANNTYNGGSGGIAIGEYTVSPGIGYAYTVGAGGAGINTSATANAGGSSSFASFASATGGGAANPTSGTGADGTGTGGTLRNTSTLWTGLSTPMGGYQTTGATTNAASTWGIGSLSQAGAFGYTSAGVGLGGNSGGIYLMWVG